MKIDEIKIKVSEVYEGYFNDDEEDVRDLGSDTSLEPDNGLSVVTRCPHCGHVYYKGSTLSCPRCGKIPGAKYDIDVDVE